MGTDCCKRKAKELRQASAGASAVPSHRKPPQTRGQAPPVSVPSLQNLWPNNDLKTRPNHRGGFLLLHRGQRGPPNTRRLLLQPVRRGRPPSPPAHPKLRRLPPRLPPLEEHPKDLKLPHILEPKSRSQPKLKVPEDPRTRLLCPQELSRGRRGGHRPGSLHDLAEFVVEHHFLSGFGGPEL